MKDTENVSSSDAFDLSITTHEREFRFQVMQELEEAHYQDLWKRINQAGGLRLITVK